MKYITGIFYDIKNTNKFSDAFLNIFDSINLENGVYSIIIENNHQKISQKFIYRKSDS